jgi:hypothetical protein
VGGALNHLGVEVASTDEVMQATTRLGHAGMETTEQMGTTCCFALQDKVWVADPDGASWEVYTVLADAPGESTMQGDATCCATDQAAACC